jgi:uncharacterized protein (DUF302 family)
VPDADGVVTKLSPWSLDDTVARLTALIRVRGSTLFAVIDQSTVTTGVGVDPRRSKLVTFGDPPSWATPIAVAPLVALELPLKLLIWTDRDRTLVSYTRSDAVEARYGLGSGQFERIAPLDSLTDALIAL